MSSQSQSDSLKSSSKTDPIKILPEENSSEFKDVHAKTNPTRFYRNDPSPFLNEIRNIGEELRRSAIGHYKLEFPSRKTKVPKTSLDVDNLIHDVPSTTKETIPLADELSEEKIPSLKKHVLAPSNRSKDLEEAVELLKAFSGFVLCGNDRPEKTCQPVPAEPVDPVLIEPDNIESVEKPLMLEPESERGSELEMSSMFHPESIDFDIPYHEGNPTPTPEIDESEMFEPLAEFEESQSDSEKEGQQDSVFEKEDEQPISGMIKTFQLPDIVIQMKSQHPDKFMQLTGCLDDFLDSKQQSTIAFCGLEPQVGCSTILLAIAYGLSRKEKKISVIDANFRSPTLKDCLGNSPVWGWTELLDRDFPLVSVVYIMENIRFFPLVKGVYPSWQDMEPSELCRIIQQTFRKNCNDSDVILIDCGALLPPNGDIAMGMLELFQPDGILFVKRSGRQSKLVDLRMFDNELQKHNFINFGLVENFFDPHYKKAA